MLLEKHQISLLGLLRTSMHKIMLDNYSINYQVFFKFNKHMYLRIKNNQIEVTAHPSVTFPTIERFIKKHQNWILKQLQVKKIDLYDHQQMYLWGRVYPVRLDIQPRKKSIFKDEMFHLTSSNAKAIERIYHQAIKDQIEIIIRQYEPELKKYIDLKNITYKTQLMKSRLGSCHIHKRVIKINTILARVHQRYLRLVLFHELVHLNVQDHSNKFHHLLETLYPNHRIAQREINQIIRQFNQASDIMKT